MVVIREKSSIFWNVRAMPSWEIWWGFREVISRSWKWIDLTGVGLIDAADTVEYGRLAGSVGADDGVNLSFLHRETHPG